MITIKTATGKEFESDYAVSIPNPKTAFIRIMGHTLEETREIFTNTAELPIVGFDDFHNMVDAIDEDTAVKIVLKP